MFRLLIVLSCALAAFGQLAEEQHPAPEPYSFAFSSPNDDGTSSSREETGDASGRITGSYTIQGADGQSRRVEYVADENGFRANVITNEIGTESQNTADVEVKSSAPTAAELTAQWEASGAGRARLAAPQQVLARPIQGIARGAGLASAPIAPISGGLLSGQNQRLNQGFGLRAPVFGTNAAPRAIVPAPVQAVQSVQASPLAQVQRIATPVPVTGRAASFQGSSLQSASFQGAAFIRPQGISQLSGASQQSFGAPLALDQFNLGVTPLGLQSLQNLGLGLRGVNLAGLQNTGSLLLVPNGQHAQGVSFSQTAERDLDVKTETQGRKY